MSNSEMIGATNKLRKDHDLVKEQVYEATMAIQNLVSNARDLIGDDDSEILKRVGNLLNHIEDRALYLKGYVQ